MAFKGRSTKQLVGQGVTALKGLRRIYGVANVSDVYGAKAIPFSIADIINKKA